MSSRIEIQKVYIAFFNRPADPAGLDFYARMVDSGAMQASDVAASFVGSEEYRSIYGGSSPAEVVSSVYQNLFGRAPEPQGLAYWVEALSSGTADPGMLAYQVLNGAGGTDRVVIENKADACAVFTDVVAKSSVDYSGSTLDAARSWLSTVDEKPVETVDVRNQALDIVSEATDVDLPLDYIHSFEIGFQGPYDPNGVNHGSARGIDVSREGIEISARPGYDFDGVDVLHYRELGEIGTQAFPDWETGIQLVRGDRGDGEFLMAGEAVVFTYTKNGRESTYLFVDDGRPMMGGYMDGAAEYNSDSDLLVDITGVSGLSFTGHGSISNFLAAA